jgi:hypothetical protein
MCTLPQVSQPFLFANDSNWYMLAPGQDPETGFTGEGWTLRAGARISTSVLPSGSTAQVLELPSGAEAVSPTMCVNNEYPTARTGVRVVEGGDGVHTFVSYEGTKSWEQPQNTNQIQGKPKEWVLSAPINLQPAKSLGWQRLRLLLVGGGKGSDFQIAGLYIDPRMH